MVKRGERNVLGKPKTGGRGGTRVRSAAPTGPAILAGKSTSRPQRSDTADLADFVRQRKDDEGRALRRARGLNHGRAQGIADVRARRAYERELAERERAIDDFWRQFFRKLPRQRDGAVQRRAGAGSHARPRKLGGRIAGERQLAAYSGPVLDAAGRRGVYLAVRYLRAKTAALGCARRLAYYIVAPDHVEHDAAGEALIVSNMGETATEMASAFSLMEDLNRAARVNAKVVFHVIVQLPHDVTPAERLRILRTWCETEFGDRNLPYAAAVHTPSEEGDQRNFHAHVAFSFRPMVRVAPYTFEAGRELRAELDNPEAFRAMRDDFATIMTAVSRIAGRDRTYTGLSHAGRGLKHKPTEHLGSHKTRLVRDSEHVAADARNRQAIAHNEALAATEHLKRRQGRLERQLAELHEKVKAMISVPAQGSLARARASVIRRSTAPSARSKSKQANPSWASIPPIALGAADGRSTPLLPNEAAALVACLPAQAVDAAAAVDPASGLKRRHATAPASRRHAADVSRARHITVPNATGSTKRPGEAAAAIIPLTALKRSAADGKSGAGCHFSAPDAARAPPAVPVAEGEIRAAVPIAAMIPDARPMRVTVPRSVAPSQLRSSGPTYPSAAPVPVREQRHRSVVSRCPLPSHQGPAERHLEIATPRPALSEDAIAARRARRLRRDEASRRESERAASERGAEARRRAEIVRQAEAAHKVTLAREAAARAKIKDQALLARLKQIDAYVTDHPVGGLQIEDAALRAIGADAAWVARAEVQSALGAIHAQQRRILIALAEEARARPLDFKKTGAQFWPRDLPSDHLRRLDSWAGAAGFQRDVLKIKSHVRAAHEDRESERRWVAITDAAPNLDHPPKLARPIPDGFGGMRDTPAPEHRSVAVGVHVLAFDRDGTPSPSLLRLLGHAGEKPHSIAIARDGRLTGVGPMPAAYDPLIDMWRHDDRVHALLNETIRRSREAGRAVWPERHAAAIQRAIGRPADRPIRSWQHDRDVGPEL